MVEIVTLATTIYEFLVANYFMVFWISLAIASLLIFTEGETRIPVLDTTLAVFVVVLGATIFVIGARGEPIQTITYIIADNIFTATIVAVFTGIYIQRGD